MHEGYLRVHFRPERTTNMMIEFEDVPLMLCGHPCGAHTGRAEINLELPEVIGLWLRANDGTEIDVYGQAPGVFSDFQKDQLCRTIMHDYRHQIEEERNAAFANLPREYNPGKLLPSEIR